MSRRYCAVKERGRDSAGLSAPAPETVDTKRDLSRAEEEVLVHTIRSWLDMGHAPGPVTHTQNYYRIRPATTATSETLHEAAFPEPAKYIRPCVYSR